MVEVIERRLKDEEEGINSFGDKDLLNKDLNYVLNGKRFRAYNERP